MTPDQDERLAGAGWQRIGVHNGGTVTSLAMAPRPNGGWTILAATPAGVFRSTNGGRLWRPAGPVGRLPFVASVTLSPAFATDGIAFAATWDGLFRSAAAGDSWRPVLAGGAMLVVAVSPAFAADRTVLVGTAEDGLLRSGDGGDRWIGANAGLLDLTVQALVLSPAFRDDGTAFAGTPSGLFRSQNGGKSWRAVGFDLDGESVQALALSPGFARDPLVLVGTQASGLFLSENGGTTWSQVPALEGRSISAVEIRERADGAPAIIVAAERSILVSTDRGRSWHAIGDLPAPALALVTVGDSDDILAGLAGYGLVRLFAGGAPPEDAHAGLQATPLSMLVISPDVAHDDTLFAASPDGSAFVSRDRGRTLERLALDLDEPTITGLVVSPRYREDRTVWVSTPRTLYRSRNAAITWEAMPVRAAPGSVDDEAEEPSARILTAALDVRERVVLFLAVGSRIGRSHDGGETWCWLTPIPEGMGVTSLVARPHPTGDVVLFALAESQPGSGRARSQTLWRSDDGGRRWEPWLEGVADAGPMVQGTLLGWDGPTSEPNLLVAVGRNVYAPRSDARERRRGVDRPLWRTVDLSPTLTRIAGLATPSGAAAGRVIFAGTSTGVFVSRDGGRSFVPWSEGLDPPAVLAVAVAPDYERTGDVLALGRGGAVWRRSDR